MDMQLMPLGNGISASVRGLTFQQAEVLKVITASGLGQRIISPTGFDMATTFETTIGSLIENKEPTQQPCFKREL